ncbi:helix-turn-helix domain-containing protein [Bacillus gibsonii]|jgi:AraC-like DNA-binding protein|uniref:helix-turn-helix domain-containing protein n=1 Tax=Alkalicoccobacillus gibsonii TaxID=79881 RepID=UPI00193404E7|nr:AraC family transcriptional regulator [Alkalicoccobacillus gibsonii]MBM0064828.1 helix-turn-helix domain-containing protein [Alkalicoccobacillus gibsonii]
MHPIRKKLSSEGTMPFLLNYKITKGKEEELTEHLHDWCELIYIHKGGATFFIDQMIYELEEGDFIFIPPNSIHKSTLQGDHTLTATALFFSPSNSIFSEANRQILNQTFKKVKEDRLFRYKLSAPDQRLVLTFFERIHQEKLTMNSHWEEVCSLHILLFILQINRWFDHLKLLPNPIPPNLMWIQDSLEYIDKNLSKTVRLEDLAQIANMSTVYFSKKFKQTIGMTFSEFLATKRLLKTRELLAHTDWSIQSIAEQLGYQSMPHFFRSFKKAVGVTPSTYRKQNYKLIR